MSRNITEIVSKYNQNGYLFPLDAMSPEQALAYRSQFEAAEREYKDKDKDKDKDRRDHAAAGCAGSRQSDTGTGRAGVGCQLVY